MTESSHLRAPLAHLNGERPPAPGWFTRAIAAEPERGSLVVRGARIDTLAWGARGKPGLLFLHGNAATAEVWRFIAPFFAETHRVGALSWSGMGGSDWRPGYAQEIFLDEAMQTAEALGLFASATRPVLVGHSAGGGPALFAAHHFGARLAGVAVVDTLLRPPEEQPEPAPARPHAVYPTLVEALGRFRFAPNQPCEHLFLADWIARASLREVDGGYTWRFDPKLWRNFRTGNLWHVLGELGCPAALVNASDSPMTTEDRVARALGRFPAGTLHVRIPESHHHVMVDQPLAFVATIRALLATWQGVRQS